jgi:hypothetical protein
LGIVIRCADCNKTQSAKLAADWGHAIGYNIKMSLDAQTLTLTLQADSFFTNGMTINALRDLADQLESDCGQDEMEAPLC